METAAKSFGASLALSVGAIVVVATPACLGGPWDIALALALPVVACAATCFAVLRRPESSAWRGWSAAAWVLAVWLSGLALARSYQMPPNTALQQAWLAVALPIPVMMRARGAALLCVVATCWVEVAARDGIMLWVALGVLACISTRAHHARFARWRLEIGLTLGFAWGLLAVSASELPTWLRHGLAGLTVFTLTAVAASVFLISDTVASSEPGAAR